MSGDIPCGVSLADIKKHTTGRRVEVPMCDKCGRGDGVYFEDSGAYCDRCGWLDDSQFTTTTTWVPNSR